MSDTNQTHIDTANKLLRGEISAIETYETALGKVGDEPELAGTVQTMKDEHTKAAELLRGRVRALGGEPETGSGAWGAFANTVAGTASLLGDTAALKALKEGEEHGLKDYEAQLENFDPETRQHVEQTLIPKSKQHIAKLDALMAQA